MSTAPIPTIDVATLTSWLSDGHAFTMLDVRPTDQRYAWAIPGSIHIDAAAALWDNQPQILDSISLPRELPVVTICTVGKTSLLAADYLQAKGYEALSLEGGMQAWSQAWNIATVPLASSAAEVIQVRRLGKGCLSYIIASEGQAAVIDASLPVQIYRELAQSNGWTITAVMDTHIHADHLSRSRQLASATGARLILPVQQRATFASEQVADGETLALGSAQISVLATPGHTGESVCYLLDDQALFTGDTLALGGVGRPDLAQDAAGARRQASQLYHSIQRLFALPAQTLVLPCHSGDPIGYDAQPVATTLGELADQLHDLRLPEPAFVTRVLARIPTPPANYRTIIQLNEAGTCPEHDSLNLEAGANQCAVRS